MPAARRLACASSSLLLFMCARVWFRQLSSAPETAPPALPRHFPGAAGRPGSLGNGKQGSPRTSRSRFSAQAGPVSWVARARAQEPPAAGGESLTVFTPERGPLFRRPGCGSCRRSLGTPAAGKEERIEQARGWSICSGACEAES